MCDQLKQLLDFFLEKHDATLTTEEGIPCLLLDGFRVELEVEEERKILRFRTPLYFLPRKGREQLCLEALKGNNLLRDSHFYTLELDDSGELIRLHIDWSMDRLTDESFAHLLFNLLHVASTWQFRLEEARRAPHDTAGEAFSPDMLRI